MRRLKGICCENPSVKNKVVPFESIAKYKSNVKIKNCIIDFFLLRNHSDSKIRNVTLHEFIRQFQKSRIPNLQIFQQIFIVISFQMANCFG